MAEAISGKPAPGKKRKRRGRRFLFRLFSLLLVGGGIFYAGWVQFDLPEGTYGVVFTKTRGYAPSPLIPGRFAWSWEKLLPTNMTLHKFPLLPQGAIVDIEVALPSGELYATVLPDRVSFVSSSSYRVVYALKPAALPLLVEHEGLRPGSLAKWYVSFEDQCREVIREASTESFFILHELTRNPLDKEKILSILAHRFPAITFVSLERRRFDAPDWELYKKARVLYFATVEKKQSLLDQRARESFGRLADLEQELPLLKEYGELLVQYPALLELLKGRYLPSAPAMP